MKKILFLLFIFLAFGCSLYSQEYLAPKLYLDSKIKLKSIPGGMAVIDEENDMISFTDTQNPRFNAEASVVDRTIYIGITTRASDARGKEIRSNMKGKDIFRGVIEAFDGKFDAIQGAWYKPRPGSPLSDNLAIFNESIRSGKSLEEAALSTWTGQMALKYEYSEVTIEVLEEDKDSSRGKYQTVKVLFKKPSESLTPVSRSTSVYLSA